MDIAAAVEADLRDLLDDAEQGAYTTSTLAMLRRDIRLAVRSYLGYSVTLTDPMSLDVSVHVIDEPLDLSTVEACLRLGLGAFGSRRRGELRVYASRPPDLVDLAQHFRAFGQAPEREVVLDTQPGSTVIVPGVSGLDDFTDVYRALGVLMSRGMLLDEARRELADQADEDGVSLHDAARALLES